MGGGCVQVNNIALLNQIEESISWQTGIFAAVTLQRFNAATAMALKSYRQVTADTT
jgi:hypothetical protein